MNDKRIITKFLNKNYQKNNSHVMIYKRNDNGKRVARVLLLLSVTTTLGYTESDEINEIIDDYLKLINVC